MSRGGDTVPAALEIAIKADLHPVRRLTSPGRRALWIVPIAAVTLLAAPGVLSLRVDAGALGWALTWGASVTQVVAAVVLIGLAFRHALPGRSLPGAWLVLAWGLVLGFAVATTLRTWAVSPTTIRQASPIVIGEICFTGTMALALPLLIAGAALVSRGLNVRPWSSGALYGLGAGLGADAGWRLFCHFSDPAHVLPTHTGAVLATALLGMATVRRFRRRR